MNRPLPAEFALTAACCRWPRGEARDAAVRAAAAGAIDWARLDRVSARHRVTALVHDGLSRAGIVVPEPTRSALAARATNAAAAALRQAAEAIRIQAAFDAAPLSMLVLKGTAIALAAYGDPGIKESWDIDILTTPDEAVAARRVLEELGYRTLPPAPADDVGFARFAGLMKECVLYHPVLGISVELHWRLLDNPRLLSGLDAHARAQSVPIGESALRTFEDDALFAYLCVHGTFHGWFRIKWLADVAAFLSSRNIEQLYRDAAKFEAGRAPAVALLLSAELMGLAVPSALLEDLKSDRATVALCSVAIASMTYQRGEAELSPLSMPTLRLRASRLWIAPGRAYVTAEARNLWVSPTDRMAIRLPPQLGLIYHMLRIPLWIWRRIRGSFLNMTS